MQTSFLPSVRPTSDSFGPDLKNGRPVSNPEYEPDAVTWNRMKAEIAQLAAVAPKAVVRLYNNGGTVVCEYALGVSKPLVTAVRNGAGDVTVTFDISTGITVYMARASAVAASGIAMSTLLAEGTNAVTVYSASDCRFVLEVW